MTKRRLALPLLALALGALVLPTPVGAVSAAAMPFDFNGDGYEDLAVGVPAEDIGNRRNAGAINVIYGSASGLGTARNQHLSQDTRGIKGSPEGCLPQECGSYPGDLFGFSFASGDFDRDGYADLAVGAPYDRAGGQARAGAVTVIYGAARGLDTGRNERWSLGNLPGTPRTDDRFGAALASGDLDADGYDDLAIGADNAPVGGVRWAGMVVVVRGSPAGLTAGGSTTLTRAMTGEPIFDSFAFGTALAAGDLDGDGAADLVIGPDQWGCGGPTGGPCEDDYGQGEVVVSYGASGWPSGARVERWTLDSPGVPGDPWASDRLGSVLVVGDFNGDGYGDVAAGAPGKTLPCAPDDCHRVGAVLTLYGSAGGLVSDGSQLWHQDVPGVPGAPDPVDGWWLGSALAAGDFDGDGNDDLATSAPNQDDRRGIVLVLRGTRASGLTASRARQWTQGSPGVPGRVSAGNAFGLSLAAGDFGRSARDDLVIGVPGARVGASRHAGLVIVLFGRSGGLSGDHARTWSQATDGITGRAEPGDFFGLNLGQGSTLAR